MEEPWSRICLTWAHSLGLTPVPSILSLIDGKNHRLPVFNASDFACSLVGGFGFSLLAEKLP